MISHEHSSFPWDFDCHPAMLLLTHGCQCGVIKAQSSTVACPTAEDTNECPAKSCAQVGIP